MTLERNTKHTCTKENNYDVEVFRARPGHFDKLDLISGPHTIDENNISEKARNNYNPEAQPTRDTKEGETRNK